MVKSEEHEKPLALRVIALSGAVALCLGACAQATPAWGPGTPRNGAGQPVDSIYGTPLPGYPDVTAL